MAAASFDAALARVLAHEGGYVNHPSDPGGPTNFGITLAVYRQCVKPSASVADLRAMPRMHAKAIYRQRYWNVLSCDALPAGLDYAAFDYGVNSGPGRAARVLRALAGLSPQGEIDAEALARLSARDAKALIGALCDERLAFLKRLKTWPVFGKGWTRRVSAVRAAALCMAAGTAAKLPATKTAPGKGVVPVNKPAQQGSAGAAVAGGAAAAERAQAAGWSPALVAALILLTLIAAAAAWWFWRWRQRRQQEQIPDANVALKPPILRASRGRAKAQEPTL